MKRKVITILITVVAVLAALFITAFFAFRITRVQVTGNSMYSRNEIINTQMSDKLSYHTVFMFIKSRTAGAKKMPFAQEIDISFPDLHTVKFDVFEKNITSCVSAMDQYAYIDNDGLVLRCMDRKLKGITEFTGVGLNSFTVGKKLDVKDDSIFDRIVNISRLINHFKMDIRKVNFKDKKVTLHNRFVTVYLGEKDMYDDEMSALSAILPKIRRHRLHGIIDMTNYKKGDRIILQPAQRRNATGAAVSATGSSIERTSDTSTAAAAYE